MTAFRHCRHTRLSQALLLASLSPLAGLAQQTPAPQQLDAVTVTGSRIKRVQAEGPAPVQIIGADEIRAQGFTTVYDMLGTLNQAIGTVEADVSWGSHTPNASPLNLRNLGPNRSLLLVNGRRVADYPLPYNGQSNVSNYSNIPAAAVDRVEVLTGGASAIYGSDAIAGVVNVILKQNYSGDQFRMRGGTSTEGGRDTADVSWAGGRTGDHWSVTYALQYTSRDPLFGRDRPQMDDASDAPYSAWTTEQRRVGFRPSSGIALIDNATGTRQAPPPGACDQFGGEYYLADRLLYNRNTGVTTNTGQLCGLSADYGQWLLRSGSKDLSGYLYGTWEFGNGVQAWTNLAVFDSEAQWGTSPPYVQLPAGLDYPAFYDTASGQQLIGVRQFTASEVGSQAGLRNRNRERSWDISAGLRGTLADGRFDWEASLGRSYYRVQERISTVDWQRANDYFLGPQQGTVDGLPAYTLDRARWWTPLTPGQYAQIGAHSVNRAASWVNQGALSLSGRLFEGWAGPVEFAAVLEAAQQGYRLNPDPRANVDYEVQNVDRGGGERTRYSGGLEFGVPLTATLTATLAGRFDRYGDYTAFNDAADQLDIGTQKESTWSAGLQWRPIDSLLLRGSYATSFRAPDMHYLLGQPSSAQVRTLDQYRCIASGAYQINNCTGDNTEVTYPFAINRRGTPDLESELGNSWTVGFVWDAFENLSLTADFWRIHLEEEIRDIDETTILRDEAGCRTGLTITPGQAWSNPGGADYCASILARVQRNAAGAITAIERGPINLAQRDVSGIDLSARYQLKTGIGDFQMGLDYTNLRSMREQTYRTDPNPERRDRDIRSKLRGSVSWLYGNWNATVYGDRVGAVPGVRSHWGLDRLDNPGGCVPFADGGVPDDRANCTDTDPASPTFGQSTRKYYGRIGPAITWNVNVGYRITPAMKLNLYVNNVFNSTGYNHKDPYKLDYEFYNSRLFSPAGREIAAEYVFDF
ncbi:TonB-dependent receptor domain-containing protein [Xanthomonas euvesicatoria]|uniref:TonB-dependent receptor domain-containing protein n=1 Tax=Xanthomonas euvesicatoria TaxID=456327 RepID=UPI0030C86A53